MQSEFIHKVSEEKKNQKLIEIGAGETWTAFLEEANVMFLEEKRLRQDGDNENLSKVCQKIVSEICLSDFLLLAQIRL